MSAAANTATTRRIIEEAWNRGDFRVVDHDLSTHEDMRGLEANKERLTMYRTAVPDLHVEIDDLFANDDSVVTRWTASGTNTGDFAGMPATGRSISMTGITIDRYDADGVLVETWDHWDNMGFMQQLGMLPEGEAAQA
jgi:steroid delta-isomerase-like uncharacterized protein